MQRRTFLSASAAMTAASYSQVLGANERVNLGVIGAGGRGTQDLEAFIADGGINPAAVCDVYEPHLERALSMTGNKATAYRDFRKLLEHRGLDAVLIATPDHWHAVPTIMACRAGLDVYVEKPLSLTVEEGRKMVEAARKYNRVVQTGSQQRSGPHYKEAIEIIRSGELGEVHHVEAGLERNSMPGFGTPPDGDAPANLNYDMWLGPAPKAQYNPLRVIYNFRWFWDYSGGQMTNFGAHNLDIARWALDVEHPVSVAGFGGRFAVADHGETPDVQEVLYKFPDSVVTWAVRELNGNRGSYLEFHGTKASMDLSRNGYRITGERWQKNEAKETPDREWSSPDASRELTGHHVRNFLECVKTREKPNADVEIGHRTATMCHLGNIATRLGRSLLWDEQREQIIGDEDANRWLSREYREPWSLEI